MNVADGFLGCSFVCQIVPSMIEPLLTVTAKSS